KFYSDAAKRNMDKLKNVPREEQKTVKRELDTFKSQEAANYYTELFNDPEQQQKWAVLTFVDPFSTRQKGKSFSMKIRGAVDSEEQFASEIKRIRSFDKKFDLSKAPIGRWIGYNDVLTDTDKIDYQL